MTAEREDRPSTNLFLSLDENERALSPGESQASDLSFYMAEYHIVHRFDPVFKNVIVAKEIAAGLSGLFEFEDRTDEVRDFLKDPNAVRFVGGNHHAAVFYESGTGLMRRVEPLSDPELIPFPYLNIYRLDYSLEILPIPPQYASIKDAVDAYHAYAEPLLEQHLAEEEASLGGFKARYP